MDGKCMIIEDNELNVLNFKKHNLYKQMDNGDINKKDFDEQMFKLENKINEYIHKKLEDVKMENTKQEIKTDDVNEIKKEEKVLKKPRNITPLIIKALQMDLKTPENVINKVYEWDKSSDIELLTKKFNALMWLIRKGHQKRFDIYRWDEEKFLLTKK